jgi:hypothetical protein
MSKDINLEQGLYHEKTIDQYIVVYFIGCLRQRESEGTSGLE